MMDYECKDELVEEINENIHDDKQEDFNTEMFKLEPLEATMFAVILGTSMQQMSILDGCSHLPEGSNSDEKIQLYKTKLRDDRDKLRMILMKTRNELLHNGRFDSLIETVNELNDQDGMDYELTLNYELLMRQKAEAFSKLREQSLEHKVEEDNLANSIACVKDMIENEKTNIKIRQSFIKKWQKAKLEQFELVDINDDEKKFYDTDKEDRAHKEIVKIYEIFIEDLSKNIEDWEKRYEHDLDALKQNVKKKGQQLSQVIEKRKELQQLYTARDVEIQSWVDYKKAVEEQKQHKLKLDNTATIIQAWWRGIMVRKCLGPFKPKKTNKKVAKQNKKEKNPRMKL